MDNAGTHLPVAASLVLYGTTAPTGVRFLIELGVAVAVGYGVAIVVSVVLFKAGPGIGPPGKPS